MQRLFNWIKNKIYWIKLFRKDLATYPSKNISFKEKTFAFFKGFYPSILLINGINKKNHHLFLSTYDYAITPSPNEPFKVIAENKLNIYFLLKDYPEFLPNYYFYKDTSGFLPLYKHNKETYRLDIEHFIDFLEEKKCLACKPCLSRWGEGFMKIEKKNEFFINNKPYSTLEFIATILPLKHYIITEYVEQHPYAQEIYPHSVNTVRLLCIWNSEKKSFELVNAFHRFGSDNQTIDNLRSGSGIAVFIDLENGRFTDTIISNPHKKGFKFENITTHLTTHKDITQIEIPNWNYIKTKIIEISNQLSFLKFVGYDIAITKDGFKILEINSKPGMQSLQVGKPLLAHKWIKKTLLSQ